jgi:hypothetical protein
MAKRKRGLGRWDADELILYIDNTEPLYRQKTAQRTNLIRKACKGVFDKSRAPKLFSYLTDRAAREYRRDFGDTISTTERRKADKEFTADFMREFNACARGDYCDFTDEQIKLIQSAKCQRPTLSGRRRRRR